MNASQTVSFALSLYEMGAIQFGTYTLKSGLVSPIYIDLRVLISFPKVLHHIVALLKEKILSLPCARLCGVPYTALPIATALSLAYDIPMVLRRREVKAYGTRKKIEGEFHAGEECVVIEDLITSGASILETVTDLKEVGLHISNAIVLLDRQQGGVKRLAQQGITVHALLNLDTVLHILEENKKITPSQGQEVRSFIANHQVSSC